MHCIALISHTGVELRKWVVLVRGLDTIKMQVVNEETVKFLLCVLSSPED